ncbi:syndecan-2-like [Actinia tenebrosa]|uniref:Syndecan-2-like n=1 Tax=Actinia tenebrosa TaxID=6105 RepID=A0A6P8IIZ2_ACTTE|nr:syndecan-2-like [Actinia tenebrosa]
MRLFIVILTAFLCGLVAAADSNSKDGTMFIDSNIDVTTIKPNQKISSKDSESSGDDDDGSGDVQGDSSGSGSGVVVTPITTASQKTVRPTTREENVVPKVTVKKIPSTKPTTEPEAVTSSKKPDILTEEVGKITTTTGDAVSKTVRPTTEEDMYGGGVGNDGNVAARKQEKAGLRVLTKEVIAAVIVGGICAIILIAFLVYRLRKRDEGSYVLTDSAYKDTNKLRGDPGKEAFV